MPPHNLAAEESLLGALLLSRDAISAVAELHLNASDFYKPAHQHVFEAIRVLAAVGEPVDAVTVAEELRRNDLLDAVGGSNLLVDLQAATPAISNAPRYGRIVQDTAMLRRLIGVAGEIAELGYDEPDDVTKALDVAESKVFELADRRVVDSTKPIGDLLNLAISDLEQAYERGTALTGIPTGFTDLDELLNGLQPSTLNVVGARPSMGKCVAWDTELLDPATGELVTAAELHRRGTDGAWVQVVSLDPATGRLVVASPSAFVDDGVKPVYRVRTRLGRTVRTTLSHPFLTEAGWRPLEHLTKGDRIAVPRCLPWFGSERLGSNEAAIVAHLLGDAGLRSTVVARTDELISRCRSLDLDVTGDASPARPLAPRGSRAAHPGHGVPPRTPQLADLPRPPRGREPRLPAGPPRPGRVRGPLRAARPGHPAPVPAVRHPHRAAGGVDPASRRAPGRPRALPGAGRRTGRGARAGRRGRGRLDTPTGPRQRGRPRPRHRRVLGRDRRHRPRG